MVEVFITNASESAQIKKVLEALRTSKSALELNFDLSETGEEFPCGHSVLRIEGTEIDSEEIISKINQLGFKCEVLEDKVCK